MDFNYKNILHIIALLLLLFTVANILIIPFLSFFNIIPFHQALQSLGQIVERNTFLEIFNFVFTIAFVFFVLILIPVLWYVLVNNLGLKESLKKMRLKTKDIDIAFLWGVLSAIIIFVVITIIEFALIAMGVNIVEESNIDILDNLYSPVMLFFLVTIQPIAEEVFFRGFLLEKIEGFSGKNIAIFSTAILFGIAHMSYGLVYPVIFPIIIGFILAYIVIKTDNLYTAIISHIIFNSATYILYVLASSIV